MEMSFVEEHDLERKIIDMILASVGLEVETLTEVEIPAATNLPSPPPALYTDTPKLPFVSPPLIQVADHVLRQTCRPSYGARQHTVL